jgi:hypothetical protein
MSVQNQDPQVGPGADDLLQEQHHCTGFSHPCGTEYGEMLAKRVVDVDVGSDRAVLLQMTDFDRRGALDRGPVLSRARP